MTIEIFDVWFSFLNLFHPSGVFAYAKTIRSTQFPAALLPHQRKDGKSRDEDIWYSREFVRLCLLPPIRVYPGRLYRMFSNNRPQDSSLRKVKILLVKHRWSQIAEGVEPDPAEFPHGLQ